MEGPGWTYTLPVEKPNDLLYFPIPGDKVNNGNTSIRNTDGSWLVPETIIVTYIPPHRVFLRETSINNGILSQTG